MPIASGGNRHLQLPGWGPRISQEYDLGGGRSAVGPTIFSTNGNTCTYIQLLCVCMDVYM